jgi:hypothetical protein
MGNLNNFGNPLPQSLSNNNQNFNLNMPNLDFEMNDDINNAALSQFIDHSKFSQDSKDKNSKK